MSKVGETIRKHHEELRKNLSSMVLALVEGKPEADPKALVDFLKGDLLPHAVGEELHLYPEVEALIKTHGQATATMSIDHEFISSYIRQIEEAAKAFENASAEERPAAERQLHRLALQVEALLLVHLDKEERVYLPLFEKHLSNKEQQRVLEGMHTAYKEDAGNVKV